MNLPSKKARAGRRRRMAFDADGPDAPDTCAEKGRPDCPCPLAACEPPGMCITGLYFDPHARRYRVSDGRCPATYRYFDTLQACVPECVAYCGKPRCARRPALPCPGEKSCEDLLRSVLEAQRALTRILNAEADKLECAVECIEDFDALLWLNQSVNRTLADAAFLEQALYHELEQILELCGPCDWAETPCGQTGEGCGPCGCAEMPCGQTGEGCEGP